jgi:putative hydrolase of HD superfamily
MKFFFELGHLKILRRSGWALIGIKYPESVAEHMYRAALMGYYLAKKKGLDADKVMRMLLIHDVPEARIGDTHKVAARYIDLKDDEKKVVLDQAELLGEFGQEFINLMDEFNSQKTAEAKLAKQVDYLECVMQAREYMDAGHVHAKEWLEKTKPKITDPDCKKIYALLHDKKAAYWWEGLKKL